MAFFASAPAHRDIIVMIAFFCLFSVYSIVEDGNKNSKLPVRFSSVESLLANDSGNGKG
jgi:hypothetical protein